MKALLDSIGLVIEFITEASQFLIDFVTFTPRLINRVGVFIIQLPLFIQVPIYAFVFCAFLRAFLSRGGASS